MSRAVGLHPSVVSTLTDWKAPNPGQDALRHALLAFLDARPDACQRSCVPGHITASTLVIRGDEVLLTLHPRLGRWVQLGGHCEESDTDIAAAALREAVEESGIETLRLDPHLAAIHVHPLTCSLGAPTRHLDLQFLAYAPADAEAVISDESLDLRWWPIEEAPVGFDNGLAQLVAAAKSRPTAEAVKYRTNT